MSDDQLVAGFLPNPGRQPAETRGKRVEVQLRCGVAMIPGEHGKRATWTADHIHWPKRGDDFPVDVLGYRVV